MSSTLPPELTRSFDLDDAPSTLGESSSRVLGNTKGLSVAAYVTERLSRLNSVIPCFGDEPDFADLHDARFTAWQLGMTYEEIGDAEQESSKMTVGRSINYHLMRLPMVEQIQARNNHTISRAHNQHNEQYFKVLKGLLEEKSWMARSQALKHYRKTVALEGTSVITVNVDNRKQSATFNTAGKGSFEHSMEKVRRMHREDEEEEKAKQALISARAIEEAEVVEVETVDVDKF